MIRSSVLLPFPESRSILFTFSISTLVNLHYSATKRSKTGFYFRRRIIRDEFFFRQFRRNDLNILTCGPPLTRGLNYELNNVFCNDTCLWNT